jgi:hypothetical protein
MAFSLISNLIRNQQTKENFRGFMEPLRDALNAAYPEDNGGGGEGGASF